MMASNCPLTKIQTILTQHNALLIALSDSLKRMVCRKSLIEVEMKMAVTSVCTCVPGVCMHGAAGVVRNRNVCGGQRMNCHIRQMGGGMRFRVVGKAPPAGSLGSCAGRVL